MAGTAQRLSLLNRKAHKLLKADKELAEGFDSAIQPISEALAIDMDDAQALYMAGCWYRQKGHPGIAVQFFRRCVAIEPKHSNPWLHYGATLHDLHRYEDAIEVFKVCKGMLPNEGGIYANMAASCVQMGNFADALNYANEAIKRADSNIAKIARAIACLGLERWKEGFQEYKYLYGVKITIRTYRQPEEPEWNGTKDQTVVIQCDQGLGDEIRFASMLEDLQKDCKQVILDCHPKLQNVFARAFPGIDVFGTRKLKGVDWLKDYQLDARHHISGLGRFYRTKDKDFPRKPYLTPDPEKKAAWAEKLKDLKRPLVGIAWTGGLVATGREFRSTLLEEWRGLIETGGSFIDLSYHDSKTEIERFNAAGGGKVHRFDVDSEDYDDTLALLACLDLVVCVPTTVMHARGSMGLSAWVLVPKWTPWEFGKRREDLIWYPQGCIKLFRSPDHDFTETIKGMVDEYGRYLESQGYDRRRPETASRLYLPPEFNRQKGVETGLHHASGPPAAPDKPERADRVHF